MFFPLLHKEWNVLNLLTFPNFIKCALGFGAKLEK